MIVRAGKTDRQTQNTAKWGSKMKLWENNSNKKIQQIGQKTLNVKKELKMAKQNEIGKLQ